MVVKYKKTKSENKVEKFINEMNANGVSINLLIFFKSLAVDPNNQKEVIKIAIAQLSSRENIKRFYESYVSEFERLVTDRASMVRLANGHIGPIINNRLSNGKLLRGKASCQAWIDIMALNERESIKASSLEKLRA